MLRLTSESVLADANRRMTEAQRSGFGDDRDLGAALRAKIAEQADPPLPDDSGAVTIENERRRLIALARSQDAVLPNVIARGAYQGLLTGGLVQLAKWAFFSERK
jgi:hypothetical protein